MREGIEPLPYNYKYIRPWRSWITQQIPILKNGGSTPFGRAKKDSLWTVFFYPLRKQWHIINNGKSPLLYIISPLGLYIITHSVYKIELSQ